LWDDLDRRARDARIVLALVLGLLALWLYPTPTPWCLTGEENYTPPSQLYRGIVLMVVLSSLFGPAFANFGPRWRLERLSFEPIYRLAE
jgi:hypothetical protein